MPDKTFAIWITGLPASGKTTIARELIRVLQDEHHVPVCHLESDALRKILTPNATYTPEERDWFYHMLVAIARLLTENGANVLLDATGNFRRYRNMARNSIPHFLEVYAQCPLSVCIHRDPKGIYRRARRGETTDVPGMQAQYEEPDSSSALFLPTDQITRREAARIIIDQLKMRGMIRPV